MSNLMKLRLYVAVADWQKANQILEQMFEEELFLTESELLELTALQHKVYSHIY